MSLADLSTSVFASVWQSAVLACFAAFWARRAGLRAAQRHSMWLAVLAACAVLPFANLAVPARVVTLPALLRVASVPPARTAGDPERATLRPTVPDSAGPAAVLRRLTPRRAAALLWMLVSSVLVGRVGVAYAGSRRAKSTIAVSAPLTRAAAAFLPSSRRVRVGVSAKLAAPCAIGYRHPAIAVPQDLANSLTSEDLERVLRHECAHLARYDDVARLAQEAIGALLFFNPVVWIASRAMSLEREIACDDVAAPGERDRVAYATCLYEIARTRASARSGTAVGFFGGRSQIARRIERLLAPERHASNVRSFGGKFLLAVLAGCVISLGSVRLRGAASAHAFPVASVRVDPSGHDATAGGGSGSSPDAAPVPSPGEPALADSEGATMTSTAPGDLFDALHDAGYRGLAPHDLVDLDDHGVDAALVNALHASGAAPLPIEQLIQLADHDVTPSFVRSALAADPSLRASELATLADHGVDTALLRRLAENGSGPMDADDLARVADAGVDDSFVAHLTRTGYTALSAEQLVALANAGVTTELADRLAARARASGARPPSIDELVRRANDGEADDS